MEKRIQKKAIQSAVKSLLIVDFVDFVGMSVYELQTEIQ